VSKSKAMVTSEMCIERDAIQIIVYMFT